MKKILVVSIAAIGFAAGSHAAGVNIFYDSTFNGSNYDYTMTLAVDESSSAWSAGMGWSWITFGDVAGGTSDLADFVLTSAPPAPFDSISFSSGGHNGPTWLIGGGNIVYWTPSSASDTATWTGTSSNPGAAHTLFFSTLLVTGGADIEDYTEMIRQPVPEPATLLALGALAPIVMRRRRKA